MIRSALAQTLTLIQFIDHCPYPFDAFHLSDANCRNVLTRLEHPRPRNALEIISDLFLVDGRHKIRNLNSGVACPDAHGHFVAKGFSGAAAQARQAQVLAGERGNDDVKFFQSHDPIRLGWLTNVTHQIEKEFNRRIVGHGEYVTQNLAGPVFVQHLLFGDQNDVAALRLAFAHEVATFEEGGEADDVEWSRLHRGERLEFSL